MFNYNYIYITFNTITGKKYIGSHSTNDLNDSYIGSGTVLAKAVQKYGKEKFESVILEYTTYENLRALEQKYLDTIKPYEKSDWYNVSSSSCGGNTRDGYTDDERKRYIKKLIKNKKSFIGKSGDMNISRNREYTKEDREAAAKRMKDYYQTEAGQKHKLRLREIGARSGKSTTKPLSIIDTENNITYNFKSRKEAAETLNLPEHTIYCLIKRKTNPPKTKSGNYSLYIRYKVL